MARDSPTPKIGAGHASAMFRQGLNELRAAVYPESNIAQPTDMGIYGNATPGEISESRSADTRDKDVERKEGPDGPEME